MRMRIGTSGEQQSGDADSQRLTRLGCAIGLDVDRVMKQREAVLARILDVCATVQEAAECFEVLMLYCEVGWCGCPNHG